MTNWQILNNDTQLVQFLIGFVDIGAEPIQPFVEAISTCGTGGLDIPLTSSKVVKVEFVGHI